MQARSSDQFKFTPSLFYTSSYNEERERIYAVTRSGLVGPENIALFAFIWVYSYRLLHFSSTSACLPILHCSIIVLWCNLQLFWNTLKEIKLHQNEEQGCIAKSAFQRRKKPHHYPFYFSLQVSSSTIQPAAKAELFLFSGLSRVLSLSLLLFSNFPSVLFDLCTLCTSRLRLQFSGFCLGISGSTNHIHS